MKKILKQIKDGCILGYTGRLGNVIDFQGYKMDKWVKQHCNNTKVSVILIVIVLAVALFYYFS